MTAAAIDVLRRDSQYLRAMLDTLSSDEWATPSACEGWTVRDVIAHIGCALQEFVDPSTLPPTDPAVHTETRQEQLLAVTRDWSLEAVIDHYDEMVRRALEGLPTIAMSDTPVTFGALGTYPLHLAADGFAFDHYLHIREDLLRPRGPLDREPPVTDDLGVNAVLNWVLAALPQQNRAAAADVQGIVDIKLTRPGERRVHAVLSPAGFTLGDGTPDDADAGIESPGSQFVVWATKRADWRSFDVVVSGNEALASSFCDAVRVY